jgi:hypothetical protein
LKKKILAALIGVSILAIITMQIASSLSEDLRRTVERYHATAYFRFKCAKGRWPRTPEELFNSADPEYLNRIHEEGNLVHLIVVQKRTSHDKIVLTFSGHYLVNFEDTITFDYSTYRCDIEKDRSVYFPAPKINR